MVLYWSFTNKPKALIRNENAFETGLLGGDLLIYSMLGNEQNFFLEKEP